MITNKQVNNYDFLAELYRDAYFPNDLVDKGKKLLLNLCAALEAQKPPNLEDFYKLTQATTEQFNQLALEFEAQGSEIETVARDTIGLDMEQISKFYGYEADNEEMISNRDW